MLGSLEAGSSSVGRALSSRGLCSKHVALLETLSSVDGGTFCLLVSACFNVCPPPLCNSHVVVFFWE